MTGSRRSTGDGRHAVSPHLGVAEVQPHGVRGHLDQVPVISVRQRHAPHGRPPRDRSRGAEADENSFAGLSAGVADYRRLKGRWLRGDSLGVPRMTTWSGCRRCVAVPEAGQPSTTAPGASSPGRPAPAPVDEEVLLVVHAEAVGRQVAAGSGADHAPRAPRQWPAGEELLVPQGCSPCERGWRFRGTGPRGSAAAPAARARTAGSATATRRHRDRR